MPSTVTPGDRQSTGEKVTDDVAARSEVIVIFDRTPEDATGIKGHSAEEFAIGSSAPIKAVVFTGDHAHPDEAHAVTNVRVVGTDRWAWSRAEADAVVKELGIHAEFVRLASSRSMTRGEALLSQLLTRISGRLSRAVDDLSEADVAVLADRIASVLPSEPAPEAEAIGPVFETSDLTAWRGTSKQAIDNQRRRNTILALRTADDHWVYPEWQFDERGRVRKGVADAVKALAGAGMDPWTQAVWFRGPSPDLEGESAATWLTSGKDPGAVVQLAHRTANRWRQ